MWNRFTDQAKEAIFHAQECAAAEGQNLVEPEHLLLGILHTPNCAGLRLLAELGIETGRLASLLRIRRTRGDLGADMKLSRWSCRAIDFTYELARALGDDHIDTDHLLVGIARVHHTAASKALASLGGAVPALWTIFRRRQPNAPDELPCLVSAPHEQEPDESPRPTPLALIAVTGMMVLYFLYSLLIAAGSLGGWQAGIPEALAPLCAAVWTCLCIPVLLTGMSSCRRWGWGGMTALLFVKSAMLVGYAASFSTDIRRSPLFMSYVLFERLGVIFYILPLLAYLTFTSAAWFGIGERERWRTLLREGGWVLYITAAVEMSPLLFLLPRAG
jgi:hypothetical protein